MNTLTAPSPATLARKAEVRKYAESKLAEHRLEGWTIVLKEDIAGAAGLCNTTTKTITFSVDYLLQVPGDVWKNTVLHEIAHALTPRQNHNRLWKSVFKAIGGNGERMVESFARKVNPETYRWVGRCAACGNEVGLQAAPRVVYACGVCCEEKFDKNFLYSWFKKGEAIAHEKVGVKYAESYARNR